MVYYYGSKLFTDLADYVNMPLDQVNFLIAQLFGILIGPVFRFQLEPSQHNTFKRHLFVFSVGIMMTAFCCGTQVIYLICQSVISYVLLMFTPRQYVHM
jgi:lysophospholipid acyltransferase 1/2